MWKVAQAKERQETGQQRERYTSLSHRIRLTSVHQVRLLVQNPESEGKISQAFGLIADRKTL